MGEYYNELPDSIREHIRLIARNFEIPDAEDTLEAVAKVWIGKKGIFENQIEKAGLREVNILEKDDRKGALVMTYSGSLVDISPVIDGKRKVTYTSIGYRTNTPAHAECAGTNLSRDMTIDDTAEFNQGPIKRTSQVFKIAVCADDLSPEEEASRVTTTKTVIEEEFLEANKQIEHLD